MLDLNRLMSFVTYTPSSVRTRDIKNTLLEFVIKFDNDDMAVILGECYQGSGLITAAVANSKSLVDHDAFLNEVKSTAKSVGDVKINCPKIMVVITDRITKKLGWVSSKLIRLNETLDYPVDIRIIQFAGDVEVLRTDLAEILEEEDG